MESLGLSTYRAYRELLSLLAVIFVGSSLVLATPVATGKETVNLTAGVIESLESDHSVRTHVLSALGINTDPDYNHIDSVEFDRPKLNIAKAHMDFPRREWQYVASTSYDNCGGILASRTIAITHGVEDSYTWSVENHFGTEATAEASLDTTFGGASFGISASYDFTSSKGGSKTKSKEVSDEQGVDFPEERGVYVFALYVRSLLSDGWIPYWMDFKLDDDTPVTFRFIYDKPHSNPKGHAWLYDKDNRSTNTPTGFVNASEGYHYDFTDGTQTYAYMNRRVSSFFISDGVSARFYYDGGSIVFTHGGWNLTGGLAKWNNKFTGVYVNTYKKQTKTVNWGEVADLFPAAKTTFRITGRMQYAKTDVNDVKMQSYRMSKEAVDEECSSLELPPELRGLIAGKSQRGGHASTGESHQRTSAPRHTGQGNKVSKSTFQKMMRKGELNAVKL